VRGLHSDDAAERRRHPDRAPLIAADREVDLTGGNEGRTARGRSPGRARRVVRIAHGSAVAGVTATRGAVRLADGLAGDRRARVQHARDDRGIDGRHVSLEQARPVHHRHARQHHVVFEGHAAARERTLGRPLHPRAHIPGAQRIFLGCGARSGGARIANLGEVVGQHLEHGEVGEVRGDQPGIGREILRAQLQTQVAGNGFDLERSGRGDGHGSGTSCVRLYDLSPGQSALALRSSR
jgi:hypothetical protein